MATVAAPVNRVLSWNAKISRPPGQVIQGLADLIENTTPDVVCLQEANQYTDELRKRFSKGWFIYAHHDWPESAESPVMVRQVGHTRRRRNTKDGWSTLHTRVRWVGPEGGTHEGRTWTYVQVAGLWVMSLHRATDGDGQNRKACAEEHDRLVRWIQRHDRCLIVGDHNMSARADFPGSSSRIAEHSDSSLAFDSGEGLVDYAIQHGVRGEVRKKSHRGSDHPAVLWVAK